MPSPVTSPTGHLAVPVSTKYPRVPVLRSSASASSITILIDHKETDEIHPTRNPQASRDESLTHIAPPNSAYVSGETSPALGSLNQVESGAATTTILAGPSEKAFVVHTDLLISRSPYFKQIHTQQFFDSAGLSPSCANLCTSFTSHDTICYRDIDEFACALLVRWLYGASLAGPSDHHSMLQHLCLYVLASRFGIENLQNLVMDQVRWYYRTANVTAPSCWLEYIYSATPGPNKMRQFLVATAAYRVMSEGVLSGGLKSTLAKGGEIAIDFIQAQITNMRDGTRDVRRGNDCFWHVHRESRFCTNQISEVWHQEQSRNRG
ncbi:hypothetical protein EJ08DRAFT_284266 [Tothia fuscella]|uniref:BTB domain-containing protein n=1 Tax=Tothia fuscella TaxID=1048955 RepID=A0A9P4P1F6_9PEZI|nr:hypothetical protein EJ08DRAFT_284266 [Tothia fuscella]